jgi:hypothetical protein
MALTINPDQEATEIRPKNLVMFVSRNPCINRHEQILTQNGDAVSPLGYRPQQTERRE